MAASIKTQLYPPQKAIIKAAMEFTTEEKAFVAHAQGIIRLSVCSINRIPVGKGNPIIKPKGKIRTRVKIIFGNSPDPMDILKSNGDTEL
jgi:hypothetical protein